MNFNPLSTDSSSDNVLSSDQIHFLDNRVTLPGMKLEKKNYFIGIRPEHFNVSEESEFKFKPKIDLIENLGNEKIAYIKMDNHEISAKISSQNKIENIIGFNSNDIFLFDESGKRIQS